MKAIIVMLGLMLLISCEQYEPLSTTPAEPAKTDLGGQDIPQGMYLSAYASGAAYVVYFATDSIDLGILYKGVERYTDRIEIPDISPLDLWVETVPLTQDSVWMQLGCIRVSTKTRIRLVIKN